FFRHQHGKRGRRRRLELRRQETSPGARCREFAEVFAIVEEGQVAGAGGVKRRNVADAPVQRRVSSRLGAREAGDVVDRQFTAWRKEIRHGSPYPPPHARESGRGTTTIAIRTALRRRT